MKSFSITAITFALLMVPIGQIPATPLPENRSFLFRFPTAIDTTNLSIRYFITGSFGGYGGFVRTKPNLWEYVIDTSYEGRPAESLKAIFYCPGYGVELLNLPELNPSSVRSTDIDLKPLAAIPLSGRIILPEDATAFKVEVEYLAYWAHEFFGIVDGFVPTFKVATASMSPEGYFSVMVPDFFHDPVNNRFRYAGTIMLVLRESETGNMPYILENSDQSGRWAEFKIAENYPSDLTLYARKDK